MTAAVIHTGVAVEDRQCWLLGRFCAIAGTGAVSPVESEGKLLVQADVSSIEIKVYDSTGTLIVTLAPVVSTTIFNTLQTAEAWKKLSGGGNFRYQMPVTAVPTGATTVTAEATCTLADTTKATGIFELSVRGLYQS